MKELTQQDKMQLAKIAKSTLTWCLGFDATPTLIDLKASASEATKQPFGVEIIFKKWGSLRSKSHTIFTQEPGYKNIINNVITATKKAALFEPIRQDELQYLTLEIYIITPPHPIKDHKEINLSEQGIVFEDKHHEAMFLPGTSTQFNWDLNTTLDNLCKKAGLAPHHWKQHGRFMVFEKIPIYLEKNPL